MEDEESHAMTTDAASDETAEGDGGDIAPALSQGEGAVDIVRR